MSVCSLVSAGNRSVVLALVSQHCVPSSDIVKQYYHQYHFILVSTIYIQSQMTQPNTDIYIHTYTHLAWLLVQGTDRYVRTHASSQPWALHVSIYIICYTHTYVHGVNGLSIYPTVTDCETKSIFGQTDMDRSGFTASGVRQLPGDPVLVRRLAELAAEVVARLAREHPAVQPIHHGYS